MRLHPTLLVLALAACTPRTPPIAQHTCQGAACSACVNDAGCGDSCGPAGCTCVEGACLPRACSSDGECGSALCTAGNCAAPADPSSVVTCSILPRHVVLRDGDRVTLSVFTRDAGGLPVRAGPAALSLSGNGAGIEGQSAVGGALAGVFTITATIGSATCASDGVSVGARSAAMRVLAVDEQSGLPVSGALVQLESPAGPLTSSTGPDGAVTFAAPSPEPRTVSAFATGYDYLTLVAVSGADLVLPLRRSPAPDSHLGMKGTFGPDGLFGSQSMQVGLAGVSIPPGLLDLSLPLIVGPLVSVTIHIGNPTTVQMPSGLIFGVGRTWFKQSYQALATPGICADPSRDMAGDCAFRTAWGLAGSIPLSAIPDDLLTGKIPPAGKLLSELLPSFAGFRSAVQREVPMDAVPDQGADPAFDSFPVVPLQAEEPLRLSTHVVLPMLPSGDRTLGSVVVLAGVREAGGGLVPLGIDAGVDDSPHDGHIDADLTLRHAPAHGGLEGGAWVTMALAVDTAADGTPCNSSDASGCVAVSGLVRSSPSLPDGAEADFSGPFLGLASQAAWDGVTRTLDPGAIDGAPTIVRVLMGGGDRSWSVFAPAGSVLSVPQPPPGWVDAAVGSRMTIQAVRAPAGLSALAAGGTLSLADLLGAAEAFSSLDLPR